MNRTAQVWYYSSQIITTIEKWVKTHDKVDRCFFQYNKTDQLYLMTLRTWELRYRLPVYDILDLLVPVLRGVVSGGRGGKKRAGGSLGVTVRTLVGLRAEQILQEQIGKRFPNAEHIQVWRSTEREKQLKREKLVELDGMPARTTSQLNVLGYDSVDAFVARYSMRVQQAQAQERKNASSRKRKRKHYRFNPWL